MAAQLSLNHEFRGACTAIWVKEANHKENEMQIVFHANVYLALTVETA